MEGARTVLVEDRMEAADEEAAGEADRDGVGGVETSPPVRAGVVFVRNAAIRNRTRLANVASTGYVPSAERRWCASDNCVAVMTRPGFLRSYFSYWAESFNARRGG